MKIIKKIIKCVLYFVGIIVLYVFSSVVLSYITVNENQPKNTSKKIYLNTNGVHLSVVLPVNYLTEKLKANLHIPSQKKYARFGWANKDFYMNVPTWNDFKFKYALGALFLDTPTLIEISYYKTKKNKWVTIPITEKQLQKLNTYIANSFKLDDNQSKIIISQHIFPNYYLYTANQSYSPTKTCNTWVNIGFKESGLKASWWTLFDFGLLNKYKHD